MYANKNKDKSKSRTVATGADSTRLSSKDSRYDAGDYEAVPESIRKIRDARNRELEEQNALPAEEIIARQEAEIAELKRQAEAAAMTNKYRSVLDKDDEEEHPTFKNPDSMADFGDYEAVASTARFETAGRDPNQKVFRAKPSVAARKVAAPSDLSPGDYEAVAASARKAVSPDEYLAQQAEAQTANEEPAESAESAAIETSDNGYMTDAEAARALREAPSREVPEYTAPAPEPAEDNAIHSEPYTPPKPAPAPVSAADYAVPEPAPAPAPVSASDYMVHEQPAPAQAAPAPAPAPVSAADYTVQNYTAPARTPAPTPSNDNVISREPYTPPAAASSSYSSSASASSGYSSSSYVPPAQRNKYSDDGNYDVGGGPMYSPTSGKRIASFEDMAPGDYEAVADSSYDDSDMDLADGSYDFDKYLAGAPSLQMHPEPAVSPEEAAWADLPTSAPEDIDDVDITDEQTRALTAAIAQETLNNQPGTQFEDIIDNVIAKVLERKKAEDEAKAAAQQAEQQQNQPEQPQQPFEQQNPAAPQETEQQAQQPQNPAAPQQPETKAEQPEEPAETQEQPEPEKKQGLTPGAIDPSTPIEDIPALIVAELDSAGEVSDDDIRKSIDAALIGKLTTGELTLDSVQNVREKIMGEIHEMQEEEARILAQLEGKPEKHPFDPDFLPADIAIEDIPDAVIAELDNVEGEYSDDDVKQSIDKVMIAKLAKGELTLDSFQEARNSIFDTLGIETAEEQEEKAEEPEPEPVEEPEVQEEEPEPAEEPEEQAEEPEPVVKPAEEPEPVVEEEPQAEEDLSAEEEPITGPDMEMTQTEEPSTEPEEETVEPVEAEPETPSDEESEHAPESAESPEDEEEEEEQTTPIPVPKEPSVLEYDPYADVFVNPVDTEEPSYEEKTEESSDEPENDVQEEPTASESSNVIDESESSETEESEDDIEVAESEVVDETIESEDSEELLETPLSAAAVLAMQNQLDEQPEEEPQVEEAEVEATESEAESAVPEAETDEKSAESAKPEEPESEPETALEEPESEPEEAEESEEEQVAEPEPVEEEQAAEPEPEKHVNGNPVLDNQITFDDILRNPFVDDFEPLEPAEEPVEEQESEESTEESDDEESTEEPVVEASTDEPEDEESTEESVETPEVEESSDKQAESESENTAEPEEEIEAEPESEDAAKPKEEVEEESEEKVETEPESEGETEIVPVVEAETEGDTEQEEKPALADEPEETAEPDDEPAPVEEPEEVAEPEEEPAPAEESVAEETAEEPDEYAEAKAKRHEDMQNALLMAMIDDKEKTFSDAVNYMINQDELNAKTLRTRMPIDRDTLDRVIKEREFIPDKKTAIAICFALRLTWEDSVRLLYKAGYSLNDTQRYDLTIEYLMRRGVYDQNMINSVLMGSGLEGFGIPQSEI